MKRIIRVCFDVEAGGVLDQLHTMPAIGFTVHEFPSEVKDGNQPVLLEEHFLCMPMQKTSYDEDTRIGYWEDPAKGKPTMDVFRAQPQLWPTECALRILWLMASWHEKYGDFELGCDNPGYDAKWIASLLYRMLGEPDLEYRREFDPQDRTKTRIIQDATGRYTYRSIVDYRSTALTTLATAGEPFRARAVNKVWWHLVNTVIPTKYNVKHDHVPTNDCKSIMLAYYETMHAAGLA